jgi:organic hydroperoxide reductase OsmC/OhrA
MSDSSPQAEKKGPSEHSRFSLSMDQVQNYRFRVRFDREQFEELMLDEPRPLGEDSAPNASRILAAAVGNCLSASLLFCLQKARTKVTELHTDVTVEMTRNEKGRLRIGKIRVAIAPVLAAGDEAKLDRCRELFEDFCVVTQSVRHGVAVEVTVGA